ncbi:MAG: cell division protein FtsA [bacterium]
MPRPQIITGLDIGTSNIKVLVVERKGGDSDLEVIFQSQEPAFGVRKGIVMDVDKVARIVQIVIERVKRETGHDINSVYANISGSHLFCAPSKGMVAVSRADRKVSKEDVERVLQAAQTLSLPSNKEILEVFPKKFIVDEEGGIKEKEVVGMQGGRLETEVLLLAGFSPYKNNLTQAILDADLRVLDILPSPLASSSAVLSQRQKELGVALLDIGAGTSELAVFEEGDLIHLAIFPIGSANITNDIAIGLKTDIDMAEAIKINSGTCIFKGKDKKEKIETEEEPLVFSHKMLTRIIEARVSEIFNEVQKELKKIQKQGLLPAGVVLTGGGAKLPQIVELAKKELKLPCRLSKPSVFPGLEDNPTFATACGLVLRGIDMEGENSWSGGVFTSFRRGTIINKLKKLFQIFIP